jgi:hypothetical protein
MLNSFNKIINYKGYLGNQNLKRSGISIEWTPELLEEYIKCSEDPIYFCETYMKIINVDRGLISFKLYDYQKEMMRSMHENRFTLITTCRQAGKSTVTVGFLLWYVLFNSEKTVALLANKGDTAREILGRVQLAFEHLPKWLQQGVKEWNKGSFELENNSRVIASATSSSAIRGYSINLLFIDEASFIDNWQTFFTSVYPTISSGTSTKIVLVSTPNGLNHFYKLNEDAKNNRNGYFQIEVTWHKVPGRDEKWRDETLASMGGDLDKFAQEYECQFLGSSGTLISGWKLKELVFKIPINESNGFSIYEKPEEKHNYAIIADVSRGKGLDYSAFHVIDITKMPYNQVATFRNNLVTPVDYASIILNAAKIYNDASVLVEINDIGQQVSDTIYHSYEYENVLATESAGRSGKRLSAGFSKGADLGIRTTKSVKSIGCSLLKLLVEQNQLIINDYESILELSTFSKKGGSYEAETGKNDDLVMGLVLFSWLSDQKYFKEMTDINTLMKLRDKSEEDIHDEFMNFGYVTTGNEEHEDVIDLTDNPLPYDGYDRGLLN